MQWGNLTLPYPCEYVCNRAGVEQEPAVVLLGDGCDTQTLPLSLCVRASAQVFNKSLLSKFFWAMDAPPDFRF
jgi:hypothetical protein